jgi:hypothetical protein
MATVRQIKAIERVVENHGNISKSMREAGYPEITAKNPKNLTESKAWQDFIEEYLPDIDLASKHKELLNASRLDHMVFATGPRNEGDRLDWLKRRRAEYEEKGREFKEEEQECLTDEDIKIMLADVNCKVRRIVHRETARDVYFWSADNQARDKALDKAYKLKGSYAAEKHQSLNLNVDVDAKDTPLSELRKEYENKLKEKLVK